MKTLSTQKSLRLRIALIGLLFFIGLGTIIGRAVYLQVFFGPSLAEKASGQYEKTIQTNGKRAAVFLTRACAKWPSASRPSLWPPIPAKFKTPAKPPDHRAHPQYQTAIHRPQTGHRSVLRVGQTPDNAQRSPGAQGPPAERTGISARAQSLYPNRTLAAQLVGFTGIDGNGLEGIE